MVNAGKYTMTMDPMDLENPKLNRTATKLKMGHIHWIIWTKEPLNIPLKSSIDTKMDVQFACCMQEGYVNKGNFITHKKKLLWKIVIPFEYGHFGYLC